MTRKDFTLIAEALRVTRPHDWEEQASLQWCRTRNEVTERLRRTYPNFDEAKFTEWTNK